MLRIAVAAHRCAQMQGQRQEAGVLARAVVVQRRWRSARPHQVARRGLVERRMAAADQIAFAQVHPGEPGAHALDVV